MPSGCCRSIAEQITRASNFDAIAPSVMHQIDEALHPAFVSVLRHVPARIDVRRPIGSGQRERLRRRCRRRWPSLACCRCCASRWHCRSAIRPGSGTSSRPRSARCSRARHRVAGADLQPALPGPCRCGVLVLGPRRSEEPVQPGGSRSAGDDRPRGRHCCSSVRLATARAGASATAAGGASTLATEVCADDSQPLTTHAVRACSTAATGCSAGSAAAAWARSTRRSTTCSNVRWR